MKRAPLILLLLLALTAPLALTIWAQVGGDFALSGAVVGGGGTASGGSYELVITLAQPVTGLSTGGDYALGAGLLGSGPAVAPSTPTPRPPPAARLFLPILGR